MWEIALPTPLRIDAWFNDVDANTTESRIIPEIVYFRLEAAIFLFPVYSGVQTA